MPSYSSSERSWREDARDTNMTAATGIANAAKVSVCDWAVACDKGFRFSAFMHERATHRTYWLQATADASGKVLSVAVPVGGWALRQGFKAAKGALKRNNAKQPGTSKRSKGSADDSK